MKETDARGHSAGKNVLTTADGEWLEQCKAGNPGAWRQLHATHHAFVHRMAARLGCEPGELDDVVQETFTVAFLKLSSFTEGQLTTWLYRIVANVVSGRHRRRRVREALTRLWGGHEEPAAEVGPHEALETREANAVVAKALRRMAPKKREVFVLYELEGLPGDEVAELVGCPVATVWTRLFHARKEFEALVRADVEHP